jgi:hypothetical protein
MNKDQRDKLRSYLTEKPDNLAEITTTFDTAFSEGWEACKRHIYETFMLDDDLDEFTCCQFDVTSDCDPSLVDWCCGADNCCPEVDDVQ